MWRARRVSAILVVGLWVSAAAAGQPQSPGAAPAASDSFGPGDQVLSVGAAAFRDRLNPDFYEIEGQDGYLYAKGTFMAPLVLPAGAQIYRICAHYFNEEGGADVVTRLEAVKLTDEATGPAVIAIHTNPGGFDGGYGSFCSDLSYTYVNQGDVDGDGIAENVVHVLSVDMDDDDSLRTGLGGIRVFWRRQISPAPAAATFADVPTSHPYFPYVEALAASSITAGCGGGNFCPTEPLTRVQMAAFLSKALGLDWPF